MRTIRKTIFQALLVVIASLGMVEAGLAQFNSNNADIRDVVQRIQNDSRTLRNSAQNAADRGNYRMNELNRLLTDLDTATTQLDRRLSYRRASADDARNVLDKGMAIDTFFVNNRIRSGTLGDWQRLRSDLDQLAQAYSLNWQWNADSTYSGGYSGGTYNNSNLTDIQLRQLVQRIDSRTTTFSRNLRDDLNRRYNNDRSLDQVRQQLSAFETGVVQVRNRVNSRQIASSDVNNLLQSAAFLNNYVQNRQLSNLTETGWSQLRPDLEQLASAFNIAWNWSTYPGRYPGNGGYPGRGNLTGTYRIASDQSDDARRAVDDATRNLSLAERQRVYDSLLRRLDPPQMLAIDRKGSSVTIASTRAPQISFVADGREQVETTPSGRSVRVRAQIVGDQLSISRTGDRADDFSVNFDLTDGGRRLMVTRTLSSDRLSQPVTVRSSYDRTSDVAQLNIYDTNRETPTTGSSSSDVLGSFVIPNGTEIVAVLNSDLTTQNARENDRFTMTVRSPGQYDGATIEGYVTSIDRSGRISGRSQMTLDFDTIRLRDGRSYRFAGILENVRLPNGDVVRVDNEGAVRDSDQTNKTIQRTAIGTAVGAIIGAIAGGGKGAAIGAVVGASAGAGSVYVQGRNDLELTAGTELTVRATGPRG